MSASSPGRAPTPSAGPAVGRPFSLRMIHEDLWNIRERLTEIISTGDSQSSKKASSTLEKVDSLITRIAVEDRLRRFGR